MPKLLVGLGNPGPKYELTRHNIGFLAVDRFVARHGGSFRNEEEALAAEVRRADHSVIVLKPTTFMNLSGRAVARVAGFYKIALSDLIVVHDDLDLPFGSIRVRMGGGDGGHNGIKSIVELLGSKDFVRVKVGIGRPPPSESIPKEALITQWVLGEFPGDNRQELEAVLDRSVDASLAVYDQGLKAAQQLFNQVAGSRGVEDKAIV